MKQTVITVRGATPAPQGSKRHVGGGVMIEQSKRVKPWRQAVAQAVLDHGDWPTCYDGPVKVTFEFLFTRPAGHYGTGRNAGKLRPSARPHPSVAPDIDKLVRSTLDALTKDVPLIDDDARIVRLRAVKRYTQWEPGADIVVTEVVE